MKASVWNILAVAFLVGTVFLAVIFGVIFLIPDQVLPASMRPISVPQTLVLPSPTETVFQFPPTWTKSPIPITPSETASAIPSTPVPSETEYMLPTKSLTPSVTPTLTRTATNTYVSSKAVIVNGVVSTFTKTKKPTKTKTPLPTITPGGPPAFEAVDDYATVGPNPASIQINVLANDYNSSGTELHLVTFYDGPAHGDAEIISPAIIKYKPDPGFLGIDSLRYKMTNVGGLTDFAMVYFYVMDGSNSIPTDITLTNPTIDENLASGTVIDTFATTDPDGPGTFYYALVSGDGSTDNAVFTLTSAGVLKSKAVYNRELKSVYSIRVRSTDSGGLFLEKKFLIFINDVNEAPTINSAESVSGTVGTAFTFNVSASDPDTVETISFSIVELLPDGLILTNNGNLTATISGTPTTPGTYVVSVIATDKGTLTDSKTLTITINAGT